MYLHLMLLCSALMTGALIGTVDIKIIPAVPRLTVGVGMTLTIRCYVTGSDALEEPTWNVPATAQYSIDTNNNSRQDGSATIIKSIIFAKFREQDEGRYTCLYKDSTLESTIQLVAGCPYGKYGENCTTCSQHCLIPTSQLISPCNLTDGYCVRGCRKGYTGSRCTLPKSPVLSRITNSGTDVEQEEREDENLQQGSTVPPQNLNPEAVRAEARNDKSLQQDTTIFRTSIRPNYNKSTETTTVAKSTVSQTSPHEYIILGIVALFTIGAITFCVYKLRKKMWKCFSNLKQKMTRQNSSGHYVNVTPSQQTRQVDGTDEPLYESVH